MFEQSTICAISTASGNGAIAVIRLSGNEALSIAGTCLHFKKKGFCLQDVKPNAAIYCDFHAKGSTIDEVVVTYFKGPHSYTGEDTVEIACHGSNYIQQKILETLLNAGCKMAQPGEFTQRAFINGKLDLAQAEAVGDLIASSHAASHKVALSQMRGGISGEISELRKQLLHICSLVELELDFSEEEVEFADRTQLKALLDTILSHSTKLMQSFQLGNAIKNGVPVAIVGKTNAGKSTLLNRLLNEEKAIVSDIEGTTRDTIEDEINIDGISFRFIDTAGIRKSDDTIEKIGIERTFDKIQIAQFILHLVDAGQDMQTIEEQLNEVTVNEEQTRIVVLNKIDLVTDNEAHTKCQALLDKGYENIVSISAKQDIKTQELRDTLCSLIGVKELDNNAVVITNIRHYEALKETTEALVRAQESLENQIPTDLVAMDLRAIVQSLGQITGEISDDEILGNIFKNFCIGK